MIYHVHNAPRAPYLPIFRHMFTRCSWKKKDDDGYIFSFPDEVDQSLVTASQTLAKLPQPKMHGRGLFKFLEAVNATH